MLYLYSKQFGRNIHANFPSSCMGFVKCLVPICSQLADYTHSTTAVQGCGVDRVFIGVDSDSGVGILISTPTPAPTPACLE